MKMKVLLCAILLLGFCSSQTRPNPFNDNLFIQTFNLPAAPPTGYNSSPAQSKQSNIRSTVANPEVDALNEIARVARAQSLPSKTVRSSVDKKVYMIFKSQDEIYRHEVKEEALLSRLFGPNNLLEVGPQLLSAIPLESNLDRYAQLIRAKGDTSLYLAREAGRFLVGDAQLREYGFWAGNVVEVEPCFMQIFTDMYPLE